MAGRFTKRLDNRYTVTLTLDGKRRFFYGKTQAEANSHRERPGKVGNGCRPARPPDPERCKGCGVGPALAMSVAGATLILFPPGAHVC